MVKVNPKIAGDYLIISEVTSKIIIESVKGEVVIDNKNPKNYQSHG